MNLIKQMSIESLEMRSALLDRRLCIGGWTRLGKIKQGTIKGFTHANNG